MMLLLSGERRIDDAGAHGAEVISELRTLLARGVRAKPDPRRPGIYDVYDGRRVFFIYISPASGNVTLLATWLDGTSQEEQTASPCRVFAA
jgi:hypothetical protein